VGRRQQQGDCLGLEMWAQPLVLAGREGRKTYDSHPFPAKGTFF
jgi:hypothetical protein